VTINMVLPTVLDLHTHLISLKSSVRYCRAIVDALLMSLRKRFGGIFENCGMSGLLLPQQRSMEGVRLPFCEKVYLLASALDPRFYFHWADIEIQESVNAQNVTSAASIRDNVKDNIKRKQLIISFNA